MRFTAPPGNVDSPQRYTMSHVAMLTPFGAATRSYLCVRTRKSDVSRPTRVFHFAADAPQCLFPLYFFVAQSQLHSRTCIAHLYPRILGRSCEHLHAAFTFTVFTGEVSSRSTPKLPPELWLFHSMGRGGGDLLLQSRRVVLVERGSRCSV
jgi:hypothetical protein